MSKENEEEMGFWTLLPLFRACGLHEAIPLVHCDFSVKRYSAHLIDDAI